MTERSHLGRRQFLSRGLMAGAITVATPFDSLLARGPQHVRRGRGPSRDYGPLQPAIDQASRAPGMAMAASTSCPPAAATWARDRSLSSIR